MNINKPEDKEDNDLEESMEVVNCDHYDSSNHLQVIHSRLKHRLIKQRRKEKLEHKKRAQEDIEEIKKRKNSEEPDPDSIVKSFSLLLKLLNIKVQKIHIRYEDDYFAVDNPYSFGIVVKEISFKSCDKDIKFKSPIDVKYEEFYPYQNRNLQLKKFDVSDIRIYWNTKSESYVPSSLQEMTKGE